MPDQWGRPTIDDGISIANAAMGIDQYRTQKANLAEDRANKQADRARGLADEEAYEYAAGSMLQSGGDITQIDATDPKYKATQTIQAVKDSLTAMIRSDEFQVTKGANQQKRIDQQRVGVANQYNQAYQLFQANASGGANFVNNPGYAEMLKTYDHYHDGIELVKDESGGPIIDSKNGTVKVRTIKGREEDLPLPEPADIHQMVTNILQPGALEQAAPMNEKAYDAYNYSQIMNGTGYASDDGRTVVKFDKLIDKNDPSKRKTIVYDVDTGQEITPSEFAKGGFKELDMGGTGSAMKDAATTRKTVLSNLQTQFETALQAFSAEPDVVDISGNVTKAGKNALQVAMATLEDYQANPEKANTITGQKELAAAQKALQLWEQISGAGESAMSQAGQPAATPSWKAYDTTGAGNAGPAPAQQPAAPQQQAAPAQAVPERQATVPAQPQGTQAQPQAPQYSGLMQSENGIIWGKNANGQTVRLAIPPDTEKTEAAIKYEQAVSEASQTQNMVVDESGTIWAQNSNGQTQRVMTKPASYDEVFQYYTYLEQLKNQG